MLLDWLWTSVWKFMHKQDVVESGGQLVAQVGAEIATGKSIHSFSVHSGTRAVFHWFLPMAPLTG